MSDAGCEHRGQPDSRWQQGMHDCMRPQPHTGQAQQWRGLCMGRRPWRKVSIILPRAPSLSPVSCTLYQYALRLHHCMQEYIQCGHDHQAPLRFESSSQQLQGVCMGCGAPRLGSTVASVATSSTSTNFSSVHVSTVLMCILLYVLAFVSPHNRQSPGPFGPACGAVACVGWPAIGARPRTLLVA